jgi:hypothetical protein
VWSSIVAMCLLYANKTKAKNMKYIMKSGQYAWDSLKFTLISGLCTLQNFLNILKSKLIMTHNIFIIYIIQYSHSNTDF